jgi:hypothetical protein
VSIETISTLTRRGSRLHPASASAKQSSGHARRRRSIGPSPEKGGIVAARAAPARPIDGAGRFTGADRFILLIDRELRRAGATGFQSALGVELCGRLDRPRLARAFDAIRRTQPRAGARLVPARWLADWRLAPDRGLLAREALTWCPGRCAGATGAVGAVGAGASDASASPLTRFVAERAKAPLDPTREPLFDLAVRELRDGADPGRVRTLLVLRWWHPACDERGAELLLRELSQVYGGAEPRPAGGALAAGDEISGPRARHAAFRRARLRLEELTEAPPAALPRPAPAGGAAPLDWTLERTLLDEAATARWLAHAERRFGARSEGLAQLALVARALAAGAPDSAQIALPLTIQLRAPRARGPLLANAITFQWYSFTAAATRDEARFAEALLAMARAKVADGEERDATVLLDKARRMPLALYRRELARRDGSSRFSATLSTLGEQIGGVRELFGAPLSDLFASTVFPVPPGIGLVFARAAGRLSFTTAASTRDVAPAAASAIHRAITAALERPELTEGSS